MPKKEDSLLPAEANQECFAFHPLWGREVRGQLDGGALSSQGVGWLLREVAKRTKSIEQLAAGFPDRRDPERIEHTVRELVAQRG